MTKEELQEYDRRCEELREENEEYLALFRSQLKEKGLIARVINQHMENMDIYLNDYLLYEDAMTMEEGLDGVDMFLGDFFIRKCAWSTPATIQSTAASIKKFYACMQEHGKISKEDYRGLCDRIKNGMKRWQEECAAYNEEEDENEDEDDSDDLIDDFD